MATQQIFLGESYQVRLRFDAGTVSKCDRLSLTQRRDIAKSMMHVFRRGHAPRKVAWRNEGQLLVINTIPTESIFNIVSIGIAALTRS